MRTTNIQLSLKLKVEHKKNLPKFLYSVVSCCDSRGFLLFVLRVASLGLFLHTHLLKHSSFMADRISIASFCLPCQTNLLHVKFGQLAFKTHRHKTPPDCFLVIYMYMYIIYIYIYNFYPTLSPAILLNLVINSTIGKLPQILYMIYIYHKVTTDKTFIFLLSLSLIPLFALNHLVEPPV